MSNPKIGENEILVFVNQKIVGFHISMNYFFRMDYLECLQKLFRVPKG